MKKIFAFLVFTFGVYLSQAQFTIRVVVNTIAVKGGDDIYIAGNFNSWNPGDVKSKLKPFAGSRRIMVLDNVAAGHYEFKFTRGSWDKVETNANGTDIANRVLDVANDTTVEITIAGWKDDFPDKPKPNTSSANVHIIDSAFYIPQLDRHRKIWIYLPPSYNQSSKKSYPVLYMHDGQNLFNVQTAAFGVEWGVDECLDTLALKSKKECIVIGIDNGLDKRVNEYNPYDNEKYGKGEGRQYIDFIANTLKPFIDSNYRTLRDASHTFIAGSSMGGLISLYALVQYPDIFGGAGVFSPAFWVTPQLFTDVANTKWQKNLHIYFYAGGKESNVMIPDMQKMFELIKQKKCCSMENVTFPPGQHNESYWRNEFDNFYLWIMQ